MPDIFAAYARVYSQHGLRVFPTGGEDGKRPLIKGWRKVGRGAVDQLAAKFPAANVAFLDGGPGGVTRVDIDDPTLADDCLRRFGDTPIKVGTPSGGMHLWYRANGERRQIKVDGLAVDILGAGGMGLAPPSINSLKGAPYTFLEGSPAAIAKLPRMKPAPTASAPMVDPAASMREGDGRNRELFHRALRMARAAESKRELYQMIADANLAFAEPLAAAEVAQIAGSVWGYKSRGRLLVAGTEAVAGVTPTEIAILASNPDALALLLRLRAAHGWRHGQPFALALAMAENMQLGRRRFIEARQLLIDTHFLRLVHPGGRGKSDPPLAVLL